jgi:hypothetical protein
MIPMKNCMKFAMILATGIFLLVSIPAQSQFVTIARKIKSMRTSEADVATVILDARTFMVYRAITDTLTSNKKFTITGRDNARRFVEFTTQSYKVSMQVDSLEARLSQITVASVHPDNSSQRTTDIAVEAITRICSMAGVKCSVKEP